MRAISILTLLSCFVLTPALATGQEQEPAVPPQSLSILPLVEEGREAGPVAIEVAFLLAYPARQAFMTTVEVTGLTATEGIDFLPFTMPLNFMPGDLQKQITIKVVDDMQDEPSRELVQVSIDQPTAVESGVPLMITLTEPIAHFPIIDDDEVFQASVTSPSEGGTATVTLTRRFPSERAVIVSATPQAGSATPGSDFVAGRVRATLAPDELETSLEIPTIDDDEPEDPEQFEIALDASAGSTRFEPASLTATISDDDEQGWRVSILNGEGSIVIPTSMGTINQQAPPVSFPGRLVFDRDGLGFTLSGNGESMRFERVCEGEPDFAAAEGLDGISGSELASHGTVYWTSSPRPEIDITVAENVRTHRMRGVMLVDTEEATVTRYYEIEPVDMPTLPPEEGEDDSSSVAAPGPPSTVPDVLGVPAVKSALGSDGAALDDYLFTRVLGAEHGDGGMGNLHVSVWLDGDRNPLPADYEIADPCESGGQQGGARYMLDFELLAPEAGPDSRYFATVALIDAATGRIVQQQVSYGSTVTDAASGAYGQLGYRMPTPR